MIFNFENEEMLKYIGLAVIVIFVIYMVIRMGALQMRVVEGLRNRKDKKEEDKNSNIDDTLDKMDREVEKLKDSLLVDKYRESYEDMLIKMDERLSYEMIKYIKDGNTYSVAHVVDIKEKLDKAMKILDEVK